MIEITTVELILIVAISVATGMWYGYLLWK